jgi:hypothetical protein
MAVARMNISIPTELRLRMAAVGENWSAVCAKAIERAVGWRERANGINSIPEPDPLAIMATLVPIMTDAELSETLKLIAERLTTAPHAQRRRRVLNRLAQGVVPTKRPDEAREAELARHDAEWG